MRRASVLCAAILITTLGASNPHRALAGAVLVDSGGEVTRVRVMHHKSKTIRLTESFTSAVVGAPDIADVLPVSDRILYIQGKKIGSTNVSIFGKDKQLIAVIDIDVVIDTQAISKNIFGSIGCSGIRVTSSNQQVVLGGMACDATDAERAVAIAKAMVPNTEVINAMRVAPSQQVLLKVRYLEVDRKASREIGVNWYEANRHQTHGLSTGVGEPQIPPLGPEAWPNGGYPHGLPIFQTLSTFASGTTNAPFAVAIANALASKITIDVMITALETKGLVRMLAQPDLVALSGDKARFHAGGEVPVPVVQPSAAGTPLITIEYKKYGVHLEFTPTVLSAGIINLQIAPEVSELDYTNAVITQGYRIPAIKLRQTKTTIELRDGQSFAISGLLQSESIRDISQMPWAGSLPILGALFRSSSFQQNESDLVVIVTVHLVTPAVPGQELASPLDKRMPANDIDFFLMGRMDVRRRYDDYVANGRDIKGPYGHIVPIIQK